jgi:hypothetical protein
MGYVAAARIAQRRQATNPRACPSRPPGPEQAHVPRGALRAFSGSRTAHSTSQARLACELWRRSKIGVFSARATNRSTSEPGRLEESPLEVKPRAAV